MGISKDLKEKFTQLAPEDRLRMVRMGWEDRSTFEAIQFQFGFSANEFVLFMRNELSQNDFRRWRRRVNQQGALKNENLRGFKTTRFKCTRQSVDGITKGWK